MTDRATASMLPYPPQSSSGDSWGDLRERVRGLEMAQHYQGDHIRSSSDRMTAVDARIAACDQKLGRAVDRLTAAERTITRTIETMAVSEERLASIMRTLEVDRATRESQERSAANRKEARREALAVAQYLAAIILTVIGIAGYATGRLDKDLAKTVIERSLGATK